jgi:hypothetical protein
VGVPGIQWRHLARHPLAWCVAISVIVVSVLMFSTVGETYSASDQTAIEAAISRVATACRSTASVDAGPAIRRLGSFAQRDPGQALPLVGAASALTVGQELDALATTTCRGTPEIRQALLRAAG